MTKNIRLLTASYPEIRVPASSARKIRGFFADADRADDRLHNHTADGGQIYRYPQVQYKVLGGTPIVVAAEEGISSVHTQLMRGTPLKIGSQIYKDPAVDIHLSTHRMGDSRNMQSYRFITPWIALNQENFSRYQAEDEEQRSLLLPKILIGNLLSMCKAFGIAVEGRLTVSHHFHRVPVFYKGRQMEGFSGEFTANCFIPDLLGLGKGTARGFGTVKQQKSRGEECP